MKRALAILSILLVTAAFTGCNTMKGLGKDVEKAGEKIQKKAE